MDSKKYSINDASDNSTVVSEQVGIYGNTAQTLMSSDDNQDWRRLAVSNVMQTHTLDDKLFGSIHLPADFDYEKELSTVVNEKYGY